jgi:hypothetical protein
MKRFDRRHFLTHAGNALGAMAVASASPVADSHSANPATEKGQAGSHNIKSQAIDFRYSPLSWQTLVCFPDDPHKSLVGERGELRYSGRNPAVMPNAHYPERVEFSLLGIEPDIVAEQRLEAPGVPIIHTQIERPAASLELIAFATNQPGEGRVDNVIMEVSPRGTKAVHVSPLLIVRTKQEVKTARQGNATTLRLGTDVAPLFAVVGSPFSATENSQLGYFFTLKRDVAKPDQPLRCFIRFPQEGQDLDKIKAGLENPNRMLESARSYWKDWRPFGGKVSWELPGRYDEFLLACARNILQAREMRDGRLTFQVGPTCYRGLWVVDGHFILEAARYLGYDADAQKGLEATWAKQERAGGIFAGGGREHWKDTGIAMFSLVRQAELSQDWRYFREMQPNVLRAVRFLMELREKARSEGSANGRYGLLARGFGDGGLGGGVRSEFTNTLWVLAGLRAVTEAANRLSLSGFESAERFYSELRTSCFAAMRQEMRRHPGGFQYLPMLMKEDGQWAAADEWDRPRPQVAQWALSHAIYPGRVFEKDDPVVKGHIALMQACTQEDVPIETGWIPHGGLWTYNAPFVSHVCLWAGETDWARRTFIGFLNHASPLYCWREEQPLRGSLVCKYHGDMPHNWASAECILYLRHMLALEDGSTLRLLAGIGDHELAPGEPYVLADSPTRFGRITLNLEPLSHRQGWRLEFKRDAGPAPAALEIPRYLGQRLRLTSVTGAAASQKGNVVKVSPEALSWAATWKKRRLVF